MASTSEHRTRRGIVRGFTLYAALIAAAWCALFPILWALSGSVKTEAEISEPVLLPAHPQWSNYSDVFSLMPFWRMLANTVVYAGAVTAGQVFFCSLAGYAFARLRFTGRDTLFVLYLATLMVPLTVTVIPQFILMRTLGWVDTPWAMVVPGLFGSAFGTYLMRQFFRTLPRELEEAAVLDGCSPWQIYWRILLPNAKPAAMVLAVLTWVNVWNDFLWPLVMVQHKGIGTLTLGLVWMQGQYVSDWPVLMAASMLILLPLILVYTITPTRFPAWHSRHRAQRPIGRGGFRATTNHSVPERISKGTPMLHHSRTLLALSVAVPALVAAGLFGGDSAESAISTEQGPLTCHEGFCHGSSGSDDMLWPWIVQPWIRNFPTGSA